MGCYSFRMLVHAGMRTEYSHNVCVLMTMFIWKRTDAFDICLIRMYYSHYTDTHIHRHTLIDTQTTVIQLMDQLVFAGLIFHLREGGRAANRSITERKR